MLRVFKSQKGFTLIETLISIVVFGIIIIPLSSLFISAMTTTAVSKTQMKAVKYAQMYIEDMKSKTIEEIMNQNSDFTTSDGYEITRKIEVVNDFSIPTDAAITFDYKIILKEKADDNNMFDVNIKDNSDNDLMGSMPSYNYNSNSAVTTTIYLNQNNKKQIRFETNSITKSLDENKDVISILVDSDCSKEVNLEFSNQMPMPSVIKIYIEQKGNASPKIKQNEGMITVYNNYKQPTSNKNCEIYKLEVIVKKDGKTWAMKATKILK